MIASFVHVTLSEAAKVAEKTINADRTRTRSNADRTSLFYAYAMYLGIIPSFAGFGVPSNKNVRKGLPK